MSEFRIQASPSWRCNYYDHKKGEPHGSKCNYCNLYSPMRMEDTYLQLAYGKTLPVVKELSPEQWITGARKVFKASGKSLLWDFTGGEPLIYSGLGDLLRGVAEFSSWAITSNTSLRKKIENVLSSREVANRCGSWTASWHPNAGMGIDEFVENLRFIKSKIPGRVSVTTVLHPSTLHCIVGHLERFKREGFENNVHMFMGGIDTEPAPSDTVFQIESNKSEDILSRISEEILLKELTRPPSSDWAREPKDFPPPNDCVAGFESVAVSSDGAVYLCYLAMMNEPDPPIGYWGEWVPNSDITRDCMWECRFGCDLRLIIPPA